MIKCFWSLVAITSINFCSAVETKVSSFSPLEEIAGIIEVQDGRHYWKPAFPPFEGREHAGRLLGEQLLKDYGIEELKDAVVLGCPRGGMIFAQAVVDVIREAGGSPALDIVISRKIPIPSNNEFGVGAVTEQGKPVYIDRLVKELNLDLQSDTMLEIIERVQTEVKRRVEAYRQGKPSISLKDKVVVVVDGVVSGGTMIACIESARAHTAEAPRRIIAATPLASERGRSTVTDVARLPKEDFCTAVLATPPKGTVWDSDDFYQQKRLGDLTDEQVRSIMQAYRCP
jgi:putative phosphoribosyl transferase